jgi:hypothetical protein
MLHCRALCVDSLSGKAQRRWSIVGSIPTYTSEKELTENHVLVREYWAGSLITCDALASGKSGTFEKHY